MPGIKELKNRIKSISSTRKITRAMQMVSAAKMRKSQGLALSSREYSNAAWGLIKNLSKSIEFEHPLLKTYTNAKKMAVVMFSSNRGLVGSLNSNLGPKLKEVADFNNSISVEIISYGKKGKGIARRFGQNITMDFARIDKSPKIEDIYPLASEILKLYSSGEYRSIDLVYNLFHSTISQKPVVKQLLPFSEDIIKSVKEAQDISLTKTYGYNYIFEPKPENVLTHLLPRILESQIYQALLEAEASEHSARMVMMKNATEAAGDLIADLTLTFNQLRQGKITTELAEITAGRIALE